MSKAAVAAAFIFGAAAGSVVTWYFTKKTYEQIAQQEIDSVKETFSKLYKRDDDVYSGPQDASEEDEEEEDPDKTEYAAIADEEGYITYTDTDIEITEIPRSDTYEAPYVIPPESFDELEGYSVCSLTYYVCGTLTDDTDHVIEDMEGLTGFTSPSELEGHFGEYEDDSIFVRNDRLKCDIEILFDRRTFADVLAKEPYKAEV